jgi:HK97 family phage portal protein
MSWLDESIAQSLVNIQQQQQYTSQVMGLHTGGAYARYNPAWETGTPKYLDNGTAYSLAQLGYNTNSLAYACIDLWAKSIAEPPVVAVNEAGEEPEALPNHAFSKFMKRPCPGISQQEFWMATEIYRKIAGFAAWNKERNNLGQVIALWPMRPDFCSFLAGPDEPLRAIRYMPYGLPFVDIPMEEIVYFGDFNPLFPFKKPLGPTAVLAPILGLDNDITKLISTFVRNGAFLGGVLSVAQTLNDTEATRLRGQWKQMHGGSENAGDIAVLGQGATYASTAQTFKEMVFPELDARSEARICMVYGVKPILISAKIGMDRSTMNNYKEGKSSWYEENVTNEWKLLSSELTEQLLPDFEDNESLVAEFDTHKIMALQEDRNQRWKRADDGYKSGTVTLNEARQEKGLDPKDGGDEIFYGGNPMEKEEEPEVPPVIPLPEETVVTRKPEPEEEDEIKHFREFAKRRIKEGKKNIIASFEFKYVPLDDQIKLLSEFGVKAERMEPSPVELALYAELKKAVSEVKAVVA